MNPRLPFVTAMLAGLGPLKHFFEGKRVLVTGSRGYLGAYVVDSFIEMNKTLEKPCQVIAVDSRAPASGGLDEWRNVPNLSLQVHDIKRGVGLVPEKLDMVVNLAGVASPYWYKRDPLGTISAAVDGSRHMLELAKEHKATYLFTSSSVTGDAPVVVRKGGMIRRTTVAELHTGGVEDTEVLAAGDDLKSRFYPIRASAEHGFKNIIEVQFAGGTSLRLTPDHSVMVLDEKGALASKPTTDLRAGDYLLTPTDAPVIVDIATWTESRARLAGYYMADGSSGRYESARQAAASWSVSICMGAHRKHEIEDCRRTLRAEFGCDQKPQVRPTAVIINAHRQSVFEFLHPIGGNAYTKRIPESLYSAPWNIVHEFLRGWANDSHLRKSGSRSFTMVSRELADDLLALLRLHGIGCLLSTRVSKGGRRIGSGPPLPETRCWDVVVPAADALFGEPKLHAHHGRTEALRCIEVRPLRWYLTPAASTAIRRALRWNKLIGRNIAEKELNVHGLHNGAAKLIHSTIAPIKITAVVHKKLVERVYDLDVPGPQTFFAGSIPVLLHNSEVYQTASIVPTPESYVGAIPSMTDRSCYDVSKLLGETLAYTYAGMGVDTRVIRVFNSFGSLMSEADRRILPRIASAMKANRKLTVYGRQGHLPRRTYTPAANTLLGLFTVLLKGVSGEVYNVGNDSPEVTVPDLLDIVGRVTGLDPRWELVPPPSHYETEPMRRCPDITKLKGLGYRPAMELGDGLAAFFSWALETYTGAD